MKIYIALLASLSLAACSEASDNTSEAGNAPEATSEVGEAPSADAPKSTGTETAQAQQASVSSENFPAGTFWCEKTPDGQHWFYVDPDDSDKAMVGFELSEAYQAANPGETSAGSEMQRARSGSGMLYVNEQTEFRAKGNEGRLLLSDGRTAICIAKAG